MALSSCILQDSFPMTSVIVSEIFSVQRDLSCVQSNPLSAFWFEQQQNSIWLMVKQRRIPGEPRKSVLMLQKTGWYFPIHYVHQHLNLPDTQPRMCGNSCCQVSQQSPQHRNSWRGRKHIKTLKLKTLAIQTQDSPKATIALVQPLTSQNNKQKQLFEVCLDSLTHAQDGDFSHMFGAQAGAGADEGLGSTVVSLHVLDWASSQHGCFRNVGFLTWWLTCTRASISRDLGGSAKLLMTCPWKSQNVTSAKVYSSRSHEDQTNFRGRRRMQGSYLRGERGTWGGRYCVVIFEKTQSSVSQNSRFSNDSLVLVIQVHCISVSKALN